MMMLSRSSILSFAVALAAPAVAETPRVVVDIPPVHSLVAQVMEGVGAPTPLLEAGADPHNQAMRPSQAAALEDADVVIAIGPKLTPWLEKPLTSLPANAAVTILLDVEGSTLLPYRGEHDHGHGHDHVGDTDPHAWIDPENARVWLTAIAEVLSASDPDRSELYLANAAKARSSLSDLVDDLHGELAIGAFGVHHDAYQYFEKRFGIAPAFIIQEDDAHRPSPARIARLRTDVAQNDVACVFVEPGVNRGLVETVLEGSDAKVLELDLLGAGIDPGTALYEQLLREMVETMGQCK